MGNDILRDQEKIFFEAFDLKDAQRRAPWADHIESVDGGFMAFKFYSDFEQWRDQS